MGQQTPRKAAGSDPVIATLAAALIRLRARSGLTQAEVAAAMGTTQTAIARLESGRQSPTIQTLQAYARANGFCLEIGFVDATREGAGCVLFVDSSTDAA